MVVYRKDDINKVNAIPLELAVKNKDLWDRLEKIEDELSEIAFSNDFEIVEDSYVFNRLCRAIDETRTARQNLRVKPRFVG